MASTSNAIRMLGKLSKHADEVVEAGAKNLSEGNIIKATTTQLASNMTNKQKQVIGRIGREAAENARNTGRRVADASMSHNTAQKAMRRVSNGKVVADNIAHAKTVNGAAVEMGAAGANIRRGAIEASRNQLNYNTTGNALRKVRNTVDEGFVDSARTGGRNNFRTLNRADQELALSSVENEDQMNYLKEQLKKFRQGVELPDDFDDEIVKNRMRGRQHHEYAAAKIDRNNKGRTVWEQLYKEESPWARSNIRGEAVDIPQSARAELDFSGDAGQISRNFGKGQGTTIIPDTVPMDISGDIGAIENMTGSKFDTRTINGYAHRGKPTPYAFGTNFKIDDNGNKIPLAGSDHTIRLNTVPAEFIGDARQLERTTGSAINSFEIPDTRTSNFQNTNYMNVNQQANNINQQINNSFNNQLNILKGQLNQYKQGVSVNIPGGSSLNLNQIPLNQKPQNQSGLINNLNTFKINADDLRDTLKTNKGIWDVDDIKDVDAFKTMMNNDTREPINMAKAWSSIKDFSNEYLFGGIRDTYKGLQSGKGFQEAVKGAFTDADNNIRWGRVAGTYATASAGFRLLSGGGLTRDRNGNPNVIGIPFV